MVLNFEFKSFQKITRYQMPSLITINAQRALKRVSLILEPQRWAIKGPEALGGLGFRVGVVPFCFNSYHDG